MSYWVKLTREAEDDLQPYGIPSLPAARPIKSPFLRELVIPFGGTGYVALSEIAGNSTVVIAAVRHQREDDYH